MKNKQFNELVKKRKDWVRSSKENNFDFDSILYGLYNEPSHFIYELLQNAEDKGASSINFKLFVDHLEVTHNSKNDFNFDDVNGITGIGISTKKDDINKIGKFGVGFKSVFAITKSPIIKSGKYHFQIEDFVVPKSLIRNKNIGTVFKLPFNHPKRDKNEVFELIENKLQDIGLKTLLFLKNIKEIKWESPKQNGHYYKTVKVNKDAKNTEKVEIVSQTGSEECFEEYLVLNKPIKVDEKKLKVEIAYRLESDENGKDQIISVSNQESKLVVYFPTEKITYLDFIIQGPFKTTPNRENIPLDDSQNELMIDEISNLVADSLPIIKKLNLLSTSFLDVLPIDNKNCDEPIYSSIFESVKNKFLSNEKLLPTNHGDYAHPQDSILARGKVLTKLLKSRDTKILFKKSHWLDTKITFSKTRILRDYLVNKLDVGEISFEDFSEKITKEFIETKDDNWVIDFYSELIGRDSLFNERSNWQREGILRNKPIIRLKNNEHCSPFDSDGKIQVYLPTKSKSSYKTLKESIAQDENALEFLKNLKIGKPDLFSEIKEFVLPKYSDEEMNVDDAEYFEDLRKILIALSYKKSTDKRKELINKLKDLPIIDSVNPTTGENYFSKPHEVYLNIDDLRIYFNGFDSALFINIELYKKFGQKIFEEFALSIGCNQVPIRIEINANLSNEEKYQLRKKSWDKDTRITNEIYAKDYIIDGLDNLLFNINPMSSKILWKMLLKSLANIKELHRKTFFLGDYCWFYRTRKNEQFPSTFKKQLISQKWLYDRNGEIYSPTEITISDISEEYDINDDNIEVFERELGFQLDEIRRIEQKTGGKFITAEEIQDYDQWKEENKKNTQDESEKDDSWEPSVFPGEVEIRISEIELEEFISEDLSEQSLSPIRKNDKFRTYENADDRDGIPKIKIGEWGEEYVFNYLSKKYSYLKNIENTELGFKGIDDSNNSIEIKWLNRNKNIGKGYDFVISNCGEEIEYIEVKSTIKSGELLHSITGTQWWFAKKLFKEGNGNKYKIYAVKEANSARTEIKFISNPIKLWREGKLYAHPINIKI